MSATLTASDFLTYFPRVSRLMGDHNVAERIVDLDSLAPTLVRQIEQDLGFLVRRASEEKVSSAYRHLFQNPDLFRAPRELVPALYEVHAAAMLASVASAVTLTPLVGARRADVMCEIGSHRLFVEVTTYVETWPPPSKNIREFEFYERATVERSFNTIPRSFDPQYRDIPASKELRDRIKTKAGQLPAAELGLVILGAPYSETRDIEAALFGDGYCDFTRRDAEWGRYKNGLFAVSDEIGGVSRIGGVVWLRLVPVRSGVRVHARMFGNPSAALPFPSEVNASLQTIFDRRAVLRAEVERIRRVLVDQYHATRIILFGSLATELRKPGDWVHQWSDIDLAVVADTRARFTDRVGEIMRLVRPRVGLNVLVYTPDEFEREGGFFVRDEILARGHQLYP